MNWITTNYIEIIAVISGLVYILLSIKQKISCWIFGIITSVLYIYILYNSKIYADMVLQIYYVVMGIYGWINWARVNDSIKKELPVSTLNKKILMHLIPISIIGFFLIAEILIRYTDSTVPYIDAFTTILSFIATWMLTKKIVEHWIIWIIVDTVSIGLYFYRELYISIILFVIYTVMAISGYIEWRKEMNRYAI
jgi:nicotinamide mononucleotide transporter